MHECGKVIFVESHTHEITLSVERGQGIEFEQQQTFHSRTRNIPLVEGLHCCIPTLDHGKERIAG